MNAAREFQNGDRVRVNDPAPAPDVPREGKVISRTKDGNAYLVRMIVPAGGYSPLVLVPAVDLVEVQS